ncbi:hypothetical protein [Deinococcus peraridilitoris]|uniref:Uncharacterized protein n=1 Tax=Deinococcus peraridilitoris (strain DSM 19664 / LMG 22246 / CIP 109416 / KR-200) TaxID=937777 RepID=L0A0J6_DEIPD|nr:hypothetical protein [Deinococcus peraridilitoris]AFZ66530.1 hypothetical protein Deipe_0962 [Deinococcus peraridilitoris DSM 19664]
MSWTPRTLLVSMRHGKLLEAQLLLQNESGEQATLLLSPKMGARLSGAERSLALALEAAAYVTGLAVRLEAPHPHGVRLLVDGREQKSITRYGAVFAQVAELADAYADSVE